MRYFHILLVIGIVGGSLFAQNERGGSGRAGGSRIAHEKRQTDALNQNNDPRFLQFKDVIGKNLKKSVRQVSREYQKLLDSNLQLSPQQFVVVQLVAREAKVKPDVLAASVAQPKGRAMQPRRTLAVQSFEDRLQNAVVRLGNMSSGTANQAIHGAMAAVPSPPTS